MSHKFSDGLLDADDRAARLWYETKIHHVDSGQFSAQIGLVVDDEFASITVPKSVLSEPSALKKHLLNAGAELDQVEKPMIEALAASEPLSELKVTPRCGWYDDDTYLQPNWSVGTSADIVEASCISHPYDRRAGTAIAWRKRLTSPCTASSYLSFAIGVSFAAPLLSIFGEDEGVMFNLHGKSSSGKSLACRAALSVLVRARKNEIPTFDITPQGLEEHCFARNDSMIVIDEEGRNNETKAISRKKKKDMAFKVAGGQGKLRSEFANRTMQLSTASWRALGLTTGERPLDEAKMVEDRAAGERLRHIDIPVPPSRSGIFDRLKSLAPEMTPLALAMTVEETIEQNHGVALKAYIRKVVAEDRRSLKGQVKEIVSSFVSDVTDSKDNWERRFAEKFGIVLGGMLIAARLGVAPWTDKHAHRCVRKMYRLARSAIRTAEEQAKCLLKDIKIWRRQGNLPRLDAGDTYAEKEKGPKLFGIRRCHKVHGEIIALDRDILRRHLGSETGLKGVHEWLIREKYAPQCHPKQRLQLSTKGLPGDARRRWICLYAHAKG